MEYNLYKKLVMAVGVESVLENEPMAKHTTFRIGGAADYFVKPKNAEEVQKVIDLCINEKVPYYILGNGSNLLVSDNGYHGVIIQIAKDMGSIEVLDGGIIRVQAGALLSKVASMAYEQSLSGFEFASGIPGTIGGAIVMNAGAYGKEMKDVVKSAVILNNENEIKKLTAEELELGYRTSIVSKKGYIVLEVTLELHQGNQEEMKNLMDDLRNRRTTKQPLEYPSAGSTFKRPEGHFAGQLIEEAGLRGFTVGGAQVAEKHCGFVINKGQATASDVMELMNRVIARVKENSGIVLEPEIKRLGEF